MSSSTAAEALPEGTRKRGPYKKSKKTRGAILDAAAQDVRESGFQQATIESIARRAGVSVGVVYYHFSSRDEILDELMGVFVDEHHAVQQSPADANGNYFEQLAERMRGYIEFGREKPEHMRIFEGLRTHRPEIYRKSVRAVIERTMRELQEACAREEIRDLDKDEMTVLSHVLLGSAYFIDQLIDSLDASDYPGDELVIKTYVDLMRRGLTAPR